MTYTIWQNMQTETTVEKSRFICTLRKVASEEEAQAFIKEMKKRYWDATHNCSAYIADESGTCQRFGDDGEPAGTAGLPMLKVLQHHKLVLTAAVTTRYFGGIKLGTGGLIRAYTDSVAAAVAAAGIAWRVPMGSYAFAWPIEDVGRVLNLLYRQQLFGVGQVDYGTQAVINITAETELLPQVEMWLTEVLNKSIVLEEKQVTIAERRVAEV